MVATPVGFPKQLAFAKLRKIRLDQNAEERAAEHLNLCLARYPDLLLGSYPRVGDPDYRVKLTLESKDRDYLERAFAHLISLLPGEVVVRTE